VADHAYSFKTMNFYFNFLKDTTRYYEVSMAYFFRTLYFKYEKIKINPPKKKSMEYFVECGGFPTKKNKKPRESMHLN
jgi:hypothetical protein